MINYSVDKVKLLINKVDINIVEHLIDKMANDSRATMIYESSSIKKCRYNFILEMDEIIEEEGNQVHRKGNVYIGISPNWIFGEGSAATKRVVVEYNPNKVQLHWFSSLDILKIFYEGECAEIDIMSVDIAVDIFEYDITELVVFKRHHNEYYARIGHNKLETIYIGSFGANGHIKIYDKAIEQKVKDIKWTRFEITYKSLGSMRCRNIDVIVDTKIPLVRLYDGSSIGLDFEDISGTEKFLFLASLDNPDLLNLLDRRMRKRIKDYQKKLSPLEIQLDKIIETYKNFKIK